MNKKPQQSPLPREPRMVYFDLETMPNAKEVMKVLQSIGDFPGRTFKATINSIICFGYKVHGEKETQCVNAWDYSKRWSRDINDDYAVVRKAYEVLKDADVVVTHNGKRFDWKFLQTRLLFHGFAPLPKLIHIDTCAEAKRNLLAYSNSLNELGKFLKLGEKKKHTGWTLWMDVMEKDPAAMKLMSEYCKRDVELLEKVFKKLRPMIKSLPNYNIFNGKDNSCPNCGSTHLQRRGERVSKTKRVVRYQCVECNSWSSQGTKTPVGESST